jgi:hypothetical protein
MRARLAAFLALLAATASAQFNPSIQIKTVREGFANLSASDKGTSCPPAPGASNAVKIYCFNLDALFNPTTLQISFAHYVVSRTDGSGVLSFLATAAESRIDTQNGVSSSGAGTTSVVERSGISDVLGVALEEGAVTQTISGTNLTLQGNALSLYRFLNRDEVFQYCPEGNANCRGEFQAILNKISGSATLGLSNASTQTATGTVAMSGTSSGTTSQPSASALIQNSASHLTGFTVRYQAKNTLDLRSQAYLDAWKTAITDPSVIKLAQAVNASTAFAFFSPTTGSDDEKWMTRTRAAVKALVEDGKSSDEDLAAAITKAWDEQIPTWTKQGMSVDALKQLLEAANTYMKARDVAMNAVRQQFASGLTFEYDYSRPDNQPRVSTARVIYTLRPGTIAADAPAPDAKSGKGKGAKSAAAQTPAGSSGQAKSANDSAITFNFAADMYDNPPLGTSALRDLQAALQLDHHFGTTIATLAGYYQYQHSPAALLIGAGDLAPGTNIMLNGTAATLLAPKGNIVVAQAMVTFALKSGTKLPLGVTWSNRTDLIKGNELRGHVGFNFDWSSLVLGGQAKAANPSQPQP